MDIWVDVVGQKLRVATNLKTLVEGSQEFIRFIFNLGDDWDGLTTFAQFAQNGVGYNAYLDDENSCYLPSEIVEGTCTVILYGVGGDTVATTNFLKLTINENVLISDAESTDISYSLYSQLVTKVDLYSALMTASTGEADAEAITEAIQNALNYATVVVDELPAEGNENTNYILYTDDGCLYYKWIEDDWHIVAGSMAVIVDALPAEGNEYTDYYVFDENGQYVHYRYIGNAFYAVGNDYDITYDDSTGAFVFYQNGVEKTSVTIIGGSGSGSSNSAVLTATNTSGWLSKTIAYGTSCAVTFEWSSLENDLSTGAGTLTIIVNNATKATKSINQGEVSVDVTDYLSVGSNTVKMKISDVYGNSKTINYNITTVSVSLSSSFDVSSPFEGSITFPYTPVGSVTKTVYFIVDGETIGTATVTSSGRQLSYTIPAQSAGSHTLLVYFTATIDGEEVTSNELYYNFMCIDSDSTDTLITSSFNETEVSQYDSISIAFYVYVPGSLTADTVELYANGNLVNTLSSVDRSEQTWVYRADTVGSLTLTISCNGTEKTFSITVTETEIDAEAETEDLVLYLSSYGRSNSEADPSIWEDSDNGISATLTDFNYTSDGWQTDDDGITVLRVSGDARVKIPLQIFASDFRTTGKTIEIEFATRDVRNYDSAIFSCMSGERGLELTSQLATFASEQSTLTMQYKEDEHIRLSFVVEKRSENRLAYAYVDGILSGVVQYPTDDDFAQVSPVDITIGSNDCTTDIYCIRVYDNDLTRYQILDNWIADTQVGATMLERFTHNNVYDAYGQIVIDQLPSDLPYLVFEADALPTYKGNKLTVEGYYINPEDNSKNFTFTGASIDVQGTSSAGYARKNYKVKFSGGFTNDNGTTSSTYQLRDDSVPTKTFTFKADVASSEGANNVELVRLYNDSCTYQTPPQKEDSTIRQGIDGFPIVIFWDDGTDVTFLGKYNFNNDKGTEEVYGFEDGDESWEILNNTSDRVVWKNDDFSDDDWLNDFEARYPEDNTDSTNLAAFSSWLVSTDQEQATNSTLSSSVTYTNLDGDSVTYTKDSAEYRLMKFRNELEDYVMLDSALFYYLFTELFLMVDSRAKNAFPTLFAEDGKWCFFPYDMDTAIGIKC